MTGMCPLIHKCCRSASVWADENSSRTYYRTICLVYMKPTMVRSAISSFCSVKPAACCRRGYRWVLGVRYIMVFIFSCSAIFNWRSLRWLFRPFLPLVCHQVAPFKQHHHRFAHHQAPCGLHVCIICCGLRNRSCHSKAWHIVYNEWLVTFEKSDAINHYHIDIVLCILDGI